MMKPDVSQTSLSPDFFEKTGKQPKQFLICQAYSVYNNGELAIAISIIETIRKLSPDAEISIMTPSPEQAERKYSKYRVKVYPKLLEMSSQSNKGIGRVFDFSKLMLKAFSYLVRLKIDNFVFSSTSKVAFDLFRKADVVIIAGGGMFGGAKYRSLTGNLFPIYLAKKLGKKVMVYGPSVEPFTSKVVKVATRYILNKADLITVREELSFDLLKSLRVTAPLHLTAEPAFLIGNEPLKAGLSLLAEAGIPMATDRLMIGMTTRNWNFPREKNSSRKREMYLNALHQTIESILEARDDALIVIFNTSINASFGDDDRVIASQIKMKLRPNLRNRVYLVTGDYTPHETKAMIGNMDIFIATRFHSAVFALSMGIPLLMVAPEPHKNHGIMKMMDLADYVMDAGSVTPDKLFAAVTRLIAHREQVAEHIEQRLSSIRELSLKNEDHLNSLLNQK